MKPAPEFSINIGVIGHRDLDADRDELTTEAVRRLLESLVTHCKPVQLKLLCGLAAGADMLVAELAVSMNIPVHGVLPMPLSRYIDDFSGVDRQRLETLLADPGVSSYELPFQANRDQCYAQLGDYLRQRSGVLLALWDGDTERLPGGTFDTLSKYLQLSRRSECGPLVMSVDAEAIPDEYAIWVPVERNGRAPAAGVPEQPVYICRDQHGKGVVLSQTLPGELRQRLDHAVEFVNLQRQHQMDISAHPTWDMSAELPESERRPELERIEQTHRSFDWLALYYQRYSDRTFAAFAYAAAAMGLCFLAYAKIVASKWLLLAYLALFVYGLVSYNRSARHHWLQHHLIYRSIAETLRVRFYLSAAGVGWPSHRDLQIAMGVEQLERARWFYLLERGLEPDGNSRTQPSAERIKWVHEHWINSQLGYFKRKAHQLHQQHERLSKIKVTIISAVVVGLVALFFFKYQLVAMTIVADFTVKQLLVFLLGLLPFWLSVWELYQGKMATRELQWQYQNQYRKFEAASNTLDSSELDSAKSTLLDLERDCVIENLLWAVQRLHREHEPPTSA
ncbi:MAG: hypothetical protein J4A00_01250 [Gammaproteobacteria bacterium]|nr:hypothetical protein [Gammaproteobacteria bacterium]